MMVVVGHPPRHTRTRHSRRGIRGRGFRARLLLRRLHLPAPQARDDRDDPDGEPDDVRQRALSRGSRPVASLYRDIPHTIAIGSGPGTFSSRAWQTFAKAGSTSASNVQGGYAQKLTGGVYETDVSKKYIDPQLREGAVIEGSGALSSPYSSYLSLAAETGLLGLALMVGVYLAAFFAASASRDS